MYDEYPDGIRCLLLLHDDRYSTVEAVRAEQHTLEKQFVGVINQCVALEQDKQVDKAIDYYERLITMHPEAKAPYVRLRVIYSKRKQYADAIRVCKTYQETRRLIDEGLEKYFGKPVADRYALLHPEVEMEYQISRLEQKIAG